MTQKKTRLGRGLGALLDDIKITTEPIENPNGEASSRKPERVYLKEIPIAQLCPGKYQPRKRFDKPELEELAESIRAQGILQPLLVRELGKNEYEIVAGERRWRAAQLASLAAVPVVVREIDDKQAMAATLVENIQRKDLNIVEAARGYKRLLDEFKLTHDEVARVIGCSRSQITNITRLLNLQDNALELLEKGKLEMGHARALLALTNPLQQRAAQQVVDNRLSVRQTEALVKQLMQHANGQDNQPKRDKLNQDIVNLMDRLSMQIGAKVDIKHGANKGKLIIHYHSLDELDGIIERIK